MVFTGDRSVLLCYNTVERMLKGDFFHTVTWDMVKAEIGQGGHIVTMEVESAQVTVWPLQDLVMQIKNIDQTWLPIRNMAASTGPMT